MATYNFTIRATDNAGAYADRSFSLNVNNTVYDRFIAVGNQGLSRSPDGVNWTWENGLTGTGAAYGGGKWLVWSIFNTTLRSSVDGTSWVTYPAAFTNPSANLPGGFSSVKYRNGAWTAFLYNSSTQEEWTSTDAINWTRVSTAFGSGTISYNIADFDYDVAGNCVAYTTYGYLLYKSAVTNSSWTQLNVSIPAQFSTHWGNLRNYNGLWILNLSGSAFVTTSVDGLNWVIRTMANTTVGLMYLNGRILSVPFNSGAAILNNLRESTNAGRTWLARSGSTTSSFPASMNTNPYRQSMCYFGGTLLMHSNGSPGIWRSLDDGQTFTSSIPTGSSGGISALAARDGIN